MSLEGFRVAVVFSGQGTQYVGMGQWLCERYALARRVMEDADAALGGGLWEVIQKGPDAQLALTVNAQPAILAVDVAFWRMLEAQGVVPWMVAGHSLGEFAALVAAGALDFVDALHIVRVRAQAMQAAMPAGEGAMVAVLGMDAEALRELCVTEDRAPDHRVCVAVWNAPQSHVISGHRAAVEAVATKLAGMRRVKTVPLAVSGPFHSPLLEGAGLALREALTSASVRPLRCPYIPNVTAQPTTDGGDILRERLVAQVSSPVRWQQSLQAILDAGATHILHAGPGNMVAAQVRQLRAAAPTPVFTLDDPPTWDRFLDILSATRSQ